MIQDQNENNLIKKTVLFPDGEQAVLVETSSPVSAKEITDGLGIIEPDAIILLFGSVDMQETDLQSRILQLFNYGLAQTAAKFNVLIIDENLYGRCMTEFSKALRVHTGNRLKRSREVGLLPVESPNAILLGITNDNEVTWPDRSDIDNDDGRRMLESSHTHFVVVKGTHPDRKIDTIDTIVESFAQKVPVLVVLVNDSPLAKDGILRSVRRGWPILIIEGSGGLADEIHHVWQKKQDDLKKLSEWDSSKTVASKTVLSFIEDPVIAEVIAKGDLQFFSITDTSEKLERRINSRLRSQSVLEGAVQLQRTYSLNANQYQKVSGRIQNTILMLGVLITSLTVFQYSYKQILGNIQLTASSFNGNLEAVLHFAILIMPIVLAVLIEGSKRSNTANKWILMRTISESIKQEVFRYRTRTGVYSDIQLIKRETTREISLASRLESITNQLAESNPDADTPPPIAKDRSITGVSQRHSSFRLRRSQTGSRLSEYLSADSYVLQRLENQIAFYKNRITKLERRWSRFQWYILGLGGFATLLTTLHFDPAVAITTAFSTALVTYLESNQVASTLRSYNNATLKLSNIRAWWIALKDAQADQENIDKLVDDTEAVLHLEMERNPLQIQKENK